MSLKPEQLKEHCEIILKSRSIKNKIVVLCEGPIPDIEGRRSVQAYKKMPEMPDANFYNRCVPKGWREKRPQFFNCGDRASVINTYFKLLTLHEQDTTNSYLEPDRLFAMIDLDLHLQKIDDYPFPDTEAIFCDLYEKSEVRSQNAALHRIWITGLIHKEAYFITPEKISSDPDLKNSLNIQRALQRINHCLNCTDLDKLQDSWKTEFKNTSEETRKHQLIRALLTIKKVKNEKQPEHDYWEKIKPPDDWSGNEKEFREQLSLKIAEFYSQQNSDVKSHIPFFIKTLYDSLFK
jgi:hypothetical protein